jgi:hypothetical protein
MSIAVELIRLIIVTVGVIVLVGVLVLIRFRIPWGMDEQPMTSNSNRLSMMNDGIFNECSILSPIKIRLMVFCQIRAKTIWNYRQVENKLGVLIAHFLKGTAIIQCL